MSPTSGTTPSAAAATTKDDSDGGGGGGDHPSQIVALPAGGGRGYRLLAWKVRDGSVVRAGETVALAAPMAIDGTCTARNSTTAATTGVGAAAAAAATATTTAPPPAQQQHKRPSRRRRPAPPPQAAAAAAKSSVPPNSEQVVKPQPPNGAPAVPPPRLPDAEADGDRKPAAKKTSATTTETTLPAADAARRIGGVAVAAAATATKPAVQHINNIKKDNKSRTIISITAKMDGILRIRDENNNNETTAADSSSITILGWIEKCQHPTAIGGLCAVCGAKWEPQKLGAEGSPTQHDAPNNGTKNNNNNAFAANGNNNGATVTAQQARSNNSSSNHDRTTMTVAGLTVTVSAAEQARMAAHDAARLHAQRKLSLVLDLDHTLVHATADPRAARFHRQGRDDVRTLVLPVVQQQPQPPPQQQAQRQQINRNNNQQQPQVWYQHYYVNLRPFVREFLDAVRDKYEVGVYTAGTREYAEEICRLLARHWARAPCDAVELDRWRHRVACLQHKLTAQQQQREQREQQQQQEPTDNAGKSNTGKDDKEGEEKKEPPAAPAASTKTARKRKRVTFGEKPEEKRDEISQRELDELRAKLGEAERLERQALELRQKLFGSRVCSRTEVGDLGTNVKSLKRIFPCGGAMAAVVDDREEVWANAPDNMKSTRRGEPPENLLWVRPYHCNSFAGFADVNNAAGADLAAATTDAAAAAPEDENDDQLLATADILKRLHQRYYSANGTSSNGNPGQLSVPKILEQMRSEVLSGCEIVLSGLVPLHKQQQQQQQQQQQRLPRPTFVRHAESLGARVENSVSESTTHVVAAKDGTDKILAARRIRGCRVVRAAWLVDCARTLTRCDEERYLLVGPPPPPAAVAAAPAAATNLQPLVDSTRGNSSGSSSGEDDDFDDFAANLEQEMMAQEEGSS